MAAQTAWGAIHFHEDGRVVLIRSAHEAGLILHIELQPEEVEVIRRGPCLQGEPRA